jgi:hypothetical protein
MNLRMRHVQHPCLLRPLSGVSTGTRGLFERVIGPDMKKQHKCSGGEGLRIWTLSLLTRGRPARAGSKDAVGVHRHIYDGATKARTVRI